MLPEPLQQRPPLPRGVRSKTHAHTAERSGLRLGGPPVQRLGSRLHVCLHLGRLGLRGVRDRRLRPADPGLARRDLDDRRARARRGRARGLGPQREDRADVQTPLVAHHDRGSQYLSLAAHRAARRTPGSAPRSGPSATATTTPSPRRINGLYKTEVITPPRTVAHRRRSRARHRRMGRLVQPPPPQRVLRRHATGRLEAATTLKTGRARRRRCRRTTGRLERHPPLRRQHAQLPRSRPQQAR